MHHTEKYKNYDELKGRFTVWLEKVVRNAKINYIKKLKREPQLVYLEEIPESVLTTQSSSYEVYTKSEFEFEEERLSKAFSKLSVPYIFGYRHIAESNSAFWIFHPD